MAKLINFTPSEETENFLGLCGWPLQGPFFLLIDYYPFAHLTPFGSAMALHQLESCRSASGTVVVPWISWWQSCHA